MSTRRLASAAASLAPPGLGSRSPAHRRRAVVLRAPGAVGRRHRLRGRPSGGTRRRDRPAMTRLPAVPPEEWSPKGTSAPWVTTRAAPRLSSRRPTSLTSAVSGKHRRSELSCASLDRSDSVSQRSRVVPALQRRVSGRAAERITGS